MSFNVVLQVVCCLFCVEKGGYIGSFDLLVIGLLLLCFGEVIKIVGLLLGLVKVYDVEIVFGQIMDIDDVEGQVLLQCLVLVISVEVLQVVLVLLMGNICQWVLIYLVLKQGGELLYVKVCRGEVIEVLECEVQVYVIEVFEQQLEWLWLCVICGFGIYICSLVCDLGEVLGCGVYISVLCWFWVELFCELVMVILDQLWVMVEVGDEVGMDVLLLLLVVGLVEYSWVDFDVEQIYCFCVGQCQCDVFWLYGLVVVFGLDDVVQGLGQVDESGLLVLQCCFNF